MFPGAGQGFRRLGGVVSVVVRLAVSVKLGMPSWTAWVRWAVVCEAARRLVRDVRMP